MFTHPLKNKKNNTTWILQQELLQIKKAHVEIVSNQRRSVQCSSHKSMTWASAHHSVTGLWASWQTDLSLLGWTATPPPPWRWQGFHKAVCSVLSCTHCSPMIASLCIIVKLADDITGGNDQREQQQGLQGGGGTSGCLVWRQQADSQHQEEYRTVDYMWHRDTHTPLNIKGCEGRVPLTSSFWESTLQTTPSGEESTEKPVISTEIRKGTTLTPNSHRILQIKNILMSSITVWCSSRRLCRGWWKLPNASLEFLLFHWR